MATIDYHRPTDVESACQLINDLEDATVVAGGQSLGLMIKEGVLDPGTLIDINDINDLIGISKAGDELRIGAVTSHRTIETSDIVAENVPVLAEAAGRIADVQIRNAGTIGGATAYADPTADYPPVFIALEAKIVTRSVEGEESYSPDEFFSGYYESALTGGELVTEIRVPVLRDDEHAAFEKLAFRENDRAIVNAAVCLGFRGETCNIARGGVGGVAERPYTIESFEDTLIGTSVSEEAIDRAAANAKEAIPVIPDPSISTDYREAMVGHIVAEALTRARDSHRGGSHD